MRRSLFSNQPAVSPFNFTFFLTLGWWGKKTRGGALIRRKREGVNPWAGVVGQRHTLKHCEGGTAVVGMLLQTPTPQTLALAAPPHLMLPGFSVLLLDHCSGATVNSPQILTLHPPCYQAAVLSLQWNLLSLQTLLSCT